MPQPPSLSPLYVNVAFASVATVRRRGQCCRRASLPPLTSLFLDLSERGHVHSLPLAVKPLVCPPPQFLIVPGCRPSSLAMVVILSRIVFVLLIARIVPSHPCSPPSLSVASLALSHSFTAESLAFFLGWHHLLSPVIIDIF
ncbi:uncharacterized protein G2W53_027911 [Senna tora]|uniref:Uncharacterized protein n=1 Tax=Senna tora TaxID=362788 RepID=A0A834WKA4_9FABA|nr:uncharacterized protein G2W53_027911 [Senna tora]